MSQPSAAPSGLGDGAVDSITSTLLEMLQGVHASQVDKDEDDKIEKSLRAFGLASGAVFVLITIAVSLNLIIAHIRAFERPELQKHVVRILFMAPIYAIVSWLSIHDAPNAEYWSFLKDCYEAFTIYSFFKLLVEIMGGEDEAARRLAKLPQIGLLAPLKYFMENWRMGPPMLLNCKYCALQYVVLKPISSILSLMGGAAGFYTPNLWAWSNVWVYDFIVYNFSQLFAMYGLVQFYLAAEPELVNWNPIPKFLCVKLVVFFTFWQGVMLSILRDIRFYHGMAGYSGEEVEAQLQNWLVCLEMMIASAAHHYAFPVSEYSSYVSLPDSSTGEGVATQAGNPKKGTLHNLKSSVLPDDVITDVHQMGQALSRRKADNGTGATAPTSGDGLSQPNVAIDLQTASV